MNNPETEGEKNENLEPSVFRVSFFGAHLIDKMAEKAEKQNGKIRENRSHTRKVLIEVRDLTLCVKLSGADIAVKSRGLIFFVTNEDLHVRTMNVLRCSSNGRSRIVCLE